ncbi:sugar diacid recognition domain-containing protein [Tepidibacillus marianensis]|uniref:sugar diacid recognition domain-containing protein n=1 Tax=Tepidibacillus marianensis TaxID=3131995 RepID=UPI0030CFEA0C
MSLLTRELAQKIVERTMSIIERNINVMNENGMIIGSGDPKRINQVHDGAVAVIKRKDVVEINEDEVKYLKGAKPGVNLPIYFKNEIVGVVGITGHPEEVRGLGLLIKMAAEMILEQAFLIEQIQWDQRLKEEILYQLISGERTTDPWFIERAKTLGIDFDIPRVAVVIEVNSMKRQNVVAILQGMIEPDDLIAIAYTTEIILLKKIKVKWNNWEKEQLVNHLQTWKSKLKEATYLDLKFGIGTYYEDFKYLTQSYNEGKNALEVGSVLFPDQEFYWYEQMGFPILIRQISDVENHPFSQHFRNIHRNDKKGELLQTLKTFIKENGEINRTADRLFIHRNTLHYRLDKIKEITGKDPKKLNDLIELYTSILLALFKK